MRFIATVSILCLAFAGWAGALDKTTKGEAVTSDEQTASSLLSQADEVFQLRDYENALTEYQKVVKQAREEFNPSVEVEALSQVARMNLILGNQDLAVKALEQATERARDSDPYGWSRYLGVKGRFEWRENDLKTARSTFDDMYSYCTVNSMWSRAIDAAHMIAIVAESPEEQIEWGKKGIEAAEANDVESWLGPLWNNLAGTYYDLKQFDSAVECYTKAREYHWKYSGEMAKLFADYHIGMANRHLGEFEEAGKWLRPVLAWAERLGNGSAIAQACEDLGEAEIGLGNKETGMKLLKRALAEYEKAGLDESWPKVYSDLKARVSELGG